MGSVYGKARLTIAASAAHNPTQGCSRWLRFEHAPIKVPYFSSANIKSGSCYMSYDMGERYVSSWGTFESQGMGIPGMAPLTTSGAFYRRRPFLDG